MKKYSGIIFNNLKPNPKSLINYGFHKNKNIFTYETMLCEDFKLIIKIEDFDIYTTVIEVTTNEEFLPIYQQNSEGEFIGRIKYLFETVLEDIAQKCFNYSIFNTTNAKDIIEYIQNKYNTQPEFLWKKFPNNAIFRNINNLKWFAAILTTYKRSLGIDEDGEIEVLNLKGNPQNIKELIDNNYYFSAYHMNKKHWFTIRLDKEFDINKIYKYIDDSYKIIQ